MKVGVRVRRFYDSLKNLNVMYARALENPAGANEVVTHFGLCEMNG